MKTIPSEFLAADCWRPLGVNLLVSQYADGRRIPLNNLEPDGVYQPVGEVPVAIFCRTSTSEKRLEGRLEAEVVASAPWGEVFEVTGNGSQVGFVLRIEPGAFCGAHVLPDMVHCIACEEELPDESTLKDVYEGKSIRVYAVGPIQDKDRPQDILVTTKTRWFRARNNPKYLGFSKDDKS